MGYAIRIKNLCYFNGLLGYATSYYFFRAAS